MPGGIKASFKSGKLGLMAITKADITNVMTSAPIVSLNNKSGSVLDPFDEPDVISSSLVPVSSS